MYLHEQKEVFINLDEYGFLTLQQENNVILISPMYIDVFLNMLNIEIEGE